MEGKKSLSKIRLAHPQHPHCAVLILLDTSGSMLEAGKIDQLREGLEFFREDLSSDSLARKRVDVAIMTFGEEVRVLVPFSPITELSYPPLEARGPTPMGEAILQAVELVEERKKLYRERGVSYYRPWIFMITDGEPTDMHPGDEKWNQVHQILEEGEKGGHFVFIGVGVEPANMEVLRELLPSNRPPIRLRPGRFREMFAWLSQSQKRVSSTRPVESLHADSLQLVNFDEWGEIPPF